MDWTCVIILILKVGETSAYSFSALDRDICLNRNLNLNFKDCQK